MHVKEKLQYKSMILQLSSLQLIKKMEVVLLSEFPIPETEYLSMKEGSLFVLFCIYEIHQTGMLQIVFLVSLESS
jgi:hypothetical protein